jgi:hypothetical protein
MFCCSAAGDLLPPMVVYKSPSGNFYDSWATGAPVGSVFTANKGGWFNMKEYENWFEKVQNLTKSHRNNLCTVRYRIS